MDLAQRGSEVLAASAHRDEEPRCARRIHRVCGRPEGLPGSPSKPCSRKRKCNCASYIWFGTAWVMCPGSSVVVWRRICGPSTRAATADEASRQLDEFAAKWDATHPTISQVWRRNWERVTPIFAFPAEIRKVVYTTNGVVSLNMSLRRIFKTRGSFPNEEAALRLLYLALRNHSQKWSFVQGWREALNRFQILWPERMRSLERA